MSQDNIDEDFKKVSEELSEEQITREIKDIEEEIERLELTISDLEMRIEDHEDPPEVVRNRLANLQNIRREKLRRLHHIKEMIQNQDEILRQVDVVENSREVVDELRQLRDRWDTEIEDALEIKAEMKSTKDRISNLENTAQSLLEQTTSAALGAEFDERKRDLEEDLQTWWKSVQISIGTLLIASIVIYIEILLSNDPFGVNLSKALLLLPISIAVWFTTSNYNRQKKLVEEYEFKARMATSMTGFREVLREDTSNDEAVVEFITNTMSEIYTNPNQNISEENGGADEVTSTSQAISDLVNK